MNSDKELRAAIEEVNFLLSGEYRNDCKCEHCQTARQKVKPLLDLAQSVLDKCLIPALKQEEPMLCHDNWHIIPSGRWIDIREEDNKIYVDGKLFFDNGTGKEAPKMTRERLIKIISDIQWSDIAICLVKDVAHLNQYNIMYSDSEKLADLILAEIQKEA